MAGFHTKTFKKHDDYMTPKHAWEAIAEFIPKDKVIWEAFYGDGTSGTDLTAMGHNVIHEEIDFFEHDLGDVIVSNPPFSLVKDIMPRLEETKKPFILLMPSSKIVASYIRNFKGDIQIIIPRKRIHFTKVSADGTKTDTKNCNFDCFYYCHGIGLPKDVIWLM